MFLRSAFSSLPLIATPALAAGAKDGLTSIEPATFLFAIATAIILTLLLRNSFAVVAERANRWLAYARVRRALRTHEVVENAILPGAYGGLVRLDFAVRLPASVACIRVLNIDGPIQGDSHAAQWSRTQNSGRRLFLNPIIQNEGRVRAIRKVVGSLPVHSVVVVVGSSPSMPDIENLIPLAQLPSVLNTLGSGTQEDLEEAWMELKAAVLSDPETQRDFDAQIGFC